MQGHARTASIAYMPISSLLPALSSYSDGIYHLSAAMDDALGFTATVEPLFS